MIISIILKSTSSNVGLSVISAFRFGLERSSYTVMENDGVVTVCVTADRGDGFEVLKTTLFTFNITTEGMHL